MRILPVILSGGAGSRLWPLSRKAKPKQLLPLISEQTLLQETLSRLDGLDDVLAPLIICNVEHRFIVAEQLRQIDVTPGAIILEPIGRNTAPAIALAALHAEQMQEEDTLLLVLPSDQLIANRRMLHDAIARSAEHATGGKLVTFGVVPDHPSTGYGYIKAGEKLSVDETFFVDCFVEKPDLTTAKNYFSSGDYYWNSGMFMFRASVFLRELTKYRCDIAESCVEAYGAMTQDGDFCRVPGELFAACPSDSIDYAVMEKTGDAAVIPLNAGWSDVGSWAALAEISQSDMQGNVIYGDVLTENTTNCYLRSENKLLTAVGVDGLVIVETEDAILVANKDKCQNVKALVEQIVKAKREEI